MSKKVESGLGVITINTAKPPDTRNINKTIKMLRNNYEKGYNNIDYLLGYTRDPTIGYEPAPLERPAKLDTNVIFTKLKHDYQDPNRDKLQTAKTKQLTMDDYFKVIGREKEVADFTNKVDESKWTSSKPTPNIITSKLNKNEEQFIKQMQSSRKSPIVRGYVGKKKI